MKNKRRYTKPKKFPDRKWNISVKKNIKNTAKRNSGIQTRREPRPSLGLSDQDPRRSSYYPVGDGPFDVNNRRAHLHFRDKVKSQEAP